MSEEDSIPLPADITRPHVIFPSEQHELAWIVAQCEMQKTQANAMDIDMLPDEEQFFPGSKNPWDYNLPKMLTPQRVMDVWTEQSEHIGGLQKDLVERIRERERKDAEQEQLRLASLGPLVKQKDALIIIQPRLSEAEQITEAIERRDEEMEYGYLQATEGASKQQLLAQETIRQLQREWNIHTTRKRHLERQLEEARMAKLESIQKKDKEKISFQSIPILALPNKPQTLHTNNEAVKPQISQPGEEAHIGQESSGIKDYLKALSEQTKASESQLAKQSHVTKPSFGKKKVPITYKSEPYEVFKPTDYDLEAPSSVNPTLLSAADIMEDELQLALVQSAKEHKIQAIANHASATSISVSDYLAEIDFNSVKEYLKGAGSTPLPVPKTLSVPPAPSGKLGESFESYMKTLKKAYADGAGARARLAKISLDEYAKSEGSLSADTYLHMKVAQANVTADDMPSADIKTVDKMIEKEIRQARWVRLCDLVIEASDFESQTQAAFLEPQTLISVDGKPYAEI